jgi:hypothetical protein
LLGFSWGRKESAFCERFAEFEEYVINKKKLPPKRTRVGQWLDNYKRKDKNWKLSEEKLNIFRESEAYPYVKIYFE